MNMPRLLAGRQRLVLARLLVNGLGQALCAIGLAWLIRTVVDHVLLGGAHPELGRLLTEVGGGVALVSVLALLRRRERIDREILAQTHAHRLRRALYARLNATAAADLVGMRRGGILLRFLGDLSAITQWVGMGLARLGVASLTIVITLAALATSSPLMVLAVSVVLLTGTAATFAMGRWMDGTVDRARQRRAIVANNITEKLSALLVVRAFGQGAREEKRLLKQSRGLRSALIDRARAIGAINAVAEATGTLATLSALLVGILAVSSRPGDAGRCRRHDDPDRHARDAKPRPGQGLRVLAPRARIRAQAFRIPVWRAAAERGERPGARALAPASSSSRASGFRESCRMWQPSSNLAAASR